MGLALQTNLVTAEEYLAVDRESEHKHEYLDGEIVAMPEGTRGHSVIAVNMAVALHTALRGRSCQVFNSDMRVQAGDDFFYPDVSVTCGRLSPERAHEDILTDPVVVVEVLSASTEGYDRGRKFASYQRIPSLAHYVLVSQHEPRVEHFRRVTGSADPPDSPDPIDNQWLLQVLGPGQTLAVHALECRIAIDEIFFDVFDDAAGA